LTEKAFSFSIKNSHRILGINEYQTFLLNDSLKMAGVIADQRLTDRTKQKFLFFEERQYAKNICHTFAN
jgi:hypothetical protein